jgi:hypothetical protein
MKKEFETCIKLFYTVENKAKLAKILAVELNIKHSQLLNFQLIESIIKREITESEKDKLHILYNARDDDDDDDRYQFVSHIITR